jgi:hypothetical protein
MAKIQTEDLAEPRRTENDLLDARVKEVKARAGLWNAIANAVDRLTEAAVAGMARPGEPEIERSGGRTTVTDPSARRR